MKKESIIPPKQTPTRSDAEDIININLYLKHIKRVFLKILEKCDAYIQT